MPSGYASVVTKGATFEQFVWTCARAFNHLSVMRDAPLSEPVPDAFEPNPIYAASLAEAKAELARICNMGLGEVAREAKKDYEEIASRNKARFVENAISKHSYTMMLDRVRSWKPPSSDAEELKGFMVDQLNASLKYDCGEVYQEKLPSTDPNEWLYNKRAELEKDVDYRQANFDKEVDRVSKANEWLRMLRESVPQPDLTNLWAKNDQNI